MIRPIWCVLGVLTAFVISFCIFKQFPGAYSGHLFVTLYILILYYTIYALLTDKEQYRKRSFLQALPLALWKYIFWGIVLFGILTFYENHPYYQLSFPHHLLFARHYFKVYLYCGLFYFLLSGKYRCSSGNTLHDPALRFLSILNQIRKHEYRTVGSRLIKGRYRHFFISSAIRIHYLPLMVEGLCALNRRLYEDISSSSLHLSNLPYLVGFLGAFAWAIDHNNAAVGYFLESDFTKTKFKAIDPFPIHYFVTLSCYAPFNSFMNTFIKNPMDIAQPDFLFNSSGFRLGTEIVLLTLVIAYAMSGTSLAFSWSNLSYKQIQTRGFYKYVRHPGTFFKLNFFIISVLRYKSSYTFGTLLALVCWLTIYFLRTLCEERFLKRYAEYRDYMKQTRYRIIPGVY